MAVAAAASARVNPRSDRGATTWIGKFTTERTSHQRTSGKKDQRRNVRIGKRVREGSSRTCALAHTGMRTHGPMPPKLKSPAPRQPFLVTYTLCHLRDGVPQGQLDLLWRRCLKTWIGHHIEAQASVSTRSARAPDLHGHPGEHVTRRVNGTV